MKKYTLRIEAPRASLSVEIGTVYSRRDADEIYLQLKGELHNYGIYSKFEHIYDTVKGEIIFRFSTSNKENIDKMFAGIIFCKAVFFTKEWSDYITTILRGNVKEDNPQEVKPPKVEAVKEVIKEEKKADKFIDTILSFKTLKVR